MNAGLGYFIAGVGTGIAFYLLGMILEQVLEERRARRRKPEA